MKILVVGGGGREHAIIKKLLQSKTPLEIYASPGNGGIGCDAVCTGIAATDIDGVVAFSKQNKIDYVVVAPDDPLVLGMVDCLEKEGIPAFGPRKAAAIIEGSKAFSKDLMKRYNIPTAAYEVFDNSDRAIKYVKKMNKYPVVIKADGLALGKGVLISENEKDAVAAITDILDGNKFGASGSRVVIEEFLAGKEVSVLSFTDGKTIVPMVSSMDHKRAHDGDTGLNTGGMGAVAPNPYYTEEIAAECMETIFLPTIEAMNKEGRTFKGCLYFGLMLTPDGPKVIEYNCRFGDPETQVVLPLLRGDLLEIFMATTNGTLDKVDFGFDGGAAACVIIASGGYPEKYEKGKTIFGLNNMGSSDKADVIVYHAGTKKQGDELVSAGGRVLGVTATASTLKKALDKAYDAARDIGFEGSFMRNDIGKSALSAIKQEGENGCF